MDHQWNNSLINQPIKCLLRLKNKLMALKRRKIKKEQTEIACFSMYMLQHSHDHQ